MSLICFLFLLAWDGSQPAAGVRDQLGEELLQQIEQLERDYEVKVVLDSVEFPKQARYSYRITARQASLPDLKHFLPLFVTEWRLMPAALVKATKLKYIVFGTAFRIPADTISRAAIPDYFQEAMFYDVRHTHDNPADRLYFRTIVHHEFFHYIDFKDDGLVYEDKQWRTLNPPEFKYGKGGARTRGAGVGLVNSRLPGFITAYAASGVEEDKAEVYRCMMMNLREMELRCEDDPVLAKKVARMKELLQTFCPEVNEEFWQQLRCMEQPRLTSPGTEDEWAMAHPVLPPLARTETVCVIEPIRECGRRVTLSDLSRAGYRSLGEYYGRR